MNALSARVIYTYKPPVSVGISVSPSGVRGLARPTASRVSPVRATPVAMIPRHGLLGGSRPVAAEPLQSLARALPTFTTCTCAMRLRCAPNVRAALSRGANPAHACRSPLSNAGAWRDYFFARMPAKNKRSSAARDRHRRLLPPMAQRCPRICSSVASRQMMR